MKKMNRILASVFCVILLAVAWMLVINRKDDTQIQQELIQQAKDLMEDKIYVRSVPILEQAAEIQAPLRDEAESLLKQCYLQLSEDYAYRNSLEDLIEKQVARKDSPIYVYEEAADYYLEGRQTTEAIAALRAGVEHTGDAALRSCYEQLRYSYTYTGYTYTDVTEIFEDMLQVQSEGLWGLADKLGELQIPCQYDKISNYSVDGAVVAKNGEIFKVDINNFRTHLLQIPGEDFGNLINDRIAVKTAEGWIRCNGNLQVSKAAFEDMGMFGKGFAAAKAGGKWGVIDIDGKWTIEPNFDEILMDNLGRCWAQNVVFARTGNDVHMYINGKEAGLHFEDAKPFTNEGWAAAKIDGKWCFIDATGKVQLETTYEDAKSFSGHLAAVMENGKWGFISLDGTMVIQAEFLEVRDFVGGCAPVKTEQGWSIIQLDEYREE